MQSTYFNATTSSTTPAPVISATSPVVIRKIVVGNPVSGGNITVFPIGNALSNNTTNIAMKITFPTFSTTNINNTVPVNIDLRSSASQGGTVEDDGLFCQAGASIVIDQTMQVTVFWDVAEG
jgi:hypothetical protein